MSDIKSYLRESRIQETNDLLQEIIDNLSKENLLVEFGNIGVRTTYALIYSEDHEVEIVVYTFLKDMKYYKENVGKLKALQQALARKKVTETDTE